MVRGSKAGGEGSGEGVEGRNKGGWEAEGAPKRVREGAVREESRSLSGTEEERVGRSWDMKDCR